VSSSSVPSSLTCEPSPDPDEGGEEEGPLPGGVESRAEAGALAGDGSDAGPLLGGLEAGGGLDAEVPFCEDEAGVFDAGALLGGEEAGVPLDGGALLGGDDSGEESAQRDQPDGGLEGGELSAGEALAVVLGVAPLLGGPARKARTALFTRPSWLGSPGLNVTLGSMNPRLCRRWKTPDAVWIGSRAPMS
jgi:hypothetical protein